MEIDSIIDSLFEKLEAQESKNKFHENGYIEPIYCLPEMTPVCLQSDLLDIPLELKNYTSVSNLDALEPCAANYSSASSKIEKSKNELSTRCEYPKNDQERQMRKNKVKKIFKCDECDFSTKENSLLITHQLIHSREKPFKCDMCEYKCKQKSRLSAHERIHSCEKPFKCDQCEYKCKQKSRLSAHQRIHSCEKPFKCDQCDYACKRKDDLTRHERIHSCEKPFKCDFSSSKKSNLITHERIHSGEKPFKCDQCDYASTRRLVSSHINIQNTTK